MTKPAAFQGAALAAVNGDFASLCAAVAQAPALIAARSGPPFEATLLHYAAAANGVEDELQRTPPNAVEIVRYLLDQGADPDATSDGYGGGPSSTPLCLLVSSWHPFHAGLQPQLVKLLVEGGAAVDGLGNDGMPLATALTFGYTAAARVLRESGARVDNLLFASGLGELDLVGSFLAILKECDGADTGGAVTEVAGSYVSAILGARSLSKAELIQEALHFAITHGRLDVTQRLVEHGASVHGITLGHHCETPLAQAVFVHEFEAARWLVKNGADPDAIDKKRGESARIMGAGRIEF